MFQWTGIPTTWIGWCGEEVANVPADEEQALKQHLAEHDCIPVFVPPDLAEGHREYSNHVLWPLFHYIPLSLLADDGDAEQDAPWVAYERVNKMYASAVMQEYNPGDLIWVQ